MNTTAGVLDFLTEKLSEVEVSLAEAEGTFQRAEATVSRLRVERDKMKALIADAKKTVSLSGTSRATPATSRASLTVKEEQLGPAGAVMKFVRARPGVAPGTIADELWNSIKTGVSGMSERRRLLISTINNMTIRGALAKDAAGGVVLGPKADK